MKNIWSTLRFQLAAWNVLTVLITALIILIGVRQGVEWALLHEMDQILREDAHEVVLALQDIDPRNFEQITNLISRKADGHRRHGWYMQLLDENRKALWSSQGVPDFPSSLALVPLNQPLSVENHRLLVLPTRVETSNVHYLKLGVHLDFLQRDMATIDRLVLGSMGIVLIVAPLLGYWLASHTARIIGGIIDTANQLEPASLEDRLPVRGTGDELDQLALTINRLLDRIATYLSQKRDFLADSAHELRSPLAAIRSSAEVALSRDRTIQEYQNLLEEIIEEGTALELIVNQLLLIAESETGSLIYDVHPLAFGLLVKRSTEIFQDVAELKNITLRTELVFNVWLRGNPQLLRQLVNNLIDNALKYTPEGGTVWIRLEFFNQKQNVRLTVQDTGIGIPPEDIPKVFDRFYRADKARPRTEQATGLGLSICKAVVAAHHGTISCESQLGQGSIFRVEFPCIPETERPTEDRPTSIG